MKKLFCLILCLIVTATCFVACADNNNNNNNQTPGAPLGDVGVNQPVVLNEALLLGNWKMVIPFSTEFLSAAATMGGASGDSSAAMGLEIMKEVTTSAQITFDVNFAQGGVAYLTASKEAFVGAFTTFFNDFITYLKNGGIYKMMELQGMDRATLDSQLAQSGMTLDQLCEQIRAQLPSTDALAQSLEGNNTMNTTMQYAYANGILTLINDEGKQITAACTYDGVSTISFSNVTNVTGDSETESFAALFNFAKLVRA